MNYTIMLDTQRYDIILTCASFFILFRQIGSFKKHKDIKSKAETGGEVKVAVAVVETVQGALIPMSLMVEVKGVEKVAGGAHQGQATVQVGR